MSRRKAVFMDIDGTLIAEGCHAPSEAVITQIERARAQGHLFCLCTGRSYGCLPQSLRGAPYIDGVVAACGTHVTLHDREIWREEIPRPVLRLLCRYFLEHKRDCLFEGEREVYATGDWLRGLHIDHEDDFETLYPDDGITKLTIPFQMQPGDQAFLAEWFSLCQMEQHFEAILLGNSKATGIQRLLAAANIAKEDSIGIGDSENDLSMIDFVGTGVAMGDAAQALKDAAQYVTASCAQDGVAQIIRTCIFGETERSEKDA